MKRNLFHKEKTMKFEIFGKEPEDMAVRIRLTEIEGHITLMAVDKNGVCLSQGNLLILHSDGTLERAPAVSPHLGFQLDSEGKIKERN